MEASRVVVVNYFQPVVVVLLSIPSANDRRRLLASARSFCLALIL